MTFRNVIVCRMVPGSERTVADVFGYYDRTTRPQDLGVVGRTLLSFHDLYIHVIERDADPKVTGQTRGLPAFQKIAEAIGPYVTPYPRYWKNPSDSVAKEFYHWAPAAGEEPAADPGSPNRTVIVARIKPGAEPTVAQIFGESDAGPLPARMGVTGRWLYSIDDVYLHVLERTDESFAGAVEEGHDQPAFAKIMNDLSPYISAYDPETWESPLDAVAKEFYRWRAED
ncbi:TcmI family type II polyketide cyclase [Micromonospora sp. NPDC092111]|uniref:TcmI family type II polyketide cyclase n=1 Tax=Micromonospora sp. NPDC092111 TaxID=3364289 RepID=UPI00381F2BF0